MIFKRLIILFFFFSASFAFSKDCTALNSNQFLKVQNELMLDSTLNKNELTHKGENKKLMAMAINFSLGMLGAHRLYLGTKPHIPVFYLLTFGGVFFILPIIDFFVLTFSKDISPYLNNDRFIMWIKP